MTQVKFNRRPFEGSFNNLLEDIFAEAPVFFKNAPANTWKGLAPANIKESDKAYSIDLIAPGFDKADFKVNIDQDTLTISAEKKQETTAEGQPVVTEKQIRNEYSFRSFKRSFTLDDKIDAGAIEAKYVNGVLTLNLPKKAEVKAAVKEISIQ